METTPVKPIPPPNRIVKDFDWPPRPLPPRPPMNLTRWDDDRLAAVLLVLLYGVLPVLLYGAAAVLLAWVLS